MHHSLCAVRAAMGGVAARLWPCVDTVQAGLWNPDTLQPALYYYSCKRASRGKFVCNSPELKANPALPWHSLMVCLFLRFCFLQIIPYLSFAYCRIE